MPAPIFRYPLSYISCEPSDGCWGAAALGACRWGRRAVAASSCLRVSRGCPGRPRGAPDRDAPIADHTWSFTGFMRNEFEGSSGWGCPPDSDGLPPPTCGPTNQGLSGNAVLRCGRGMGADGGGLHVPAAALRQPAQQRSVAGCRARLP